MHVNPYTTETGELLDKTEELDMVHKDPAEIIHEISLVMDYVDDAQMEALMGGGEKGDNPNSSQKMDDSGSPESRLGDTLNSALDEFDDLESGLDDE